MRYQLASITTSLLLCGLSPRLEAQAAEIKLMIAGSSFRSEFGSSVAGIGDLDGDGQPEVVVGAPYASPNGALRAGSVYVFATDTGELMHRVDGRRPYSGLGHQVATAGDMDGDGLPDIVVGANFLFIPGVGQAGRAYVYSGDQMSCLFAIDGDEHFGGFGFAVAGVGDLDGDGFTEVAIGKHGFGTPGKLSVYSGVPASLVFEVVGPAFLEWLPHSIAGAGDVDGDGYDDIVIGAPAEQPDGVVRVYSGATHALLHQTNGTALNADFLGMSVAGAGDLDGDGKADLFLGAPGTDHGFVFSAGVVLAYSVAQSKVLLSIPGQGDTEFFGEALANAGDVDGDGTTDVVVGGRANLEAGVVRVHSGKTGAKLFQLVGGAGDHLGVSVAGAGDIDGDGRHEVVVGSPFADPHGMKDLGAVYILGL